MKAATIIKVVRQHANLNQEELGDLVGVSKSSVSRWEAGLRGIPEKKLKKAVEACGCTLVMVARDAQGFVVGAE